jgi:predicted trehalose synthase
MADPDSRAQLGSNASNGGVAHGSTANGSTANHVALTGTVASNGRGSKRESDEIVAEIERTRENLARTIDSLADRVSPASNVRRLRERAAEEFAKPEVQLAAAAVVLAVTGIMIYRIWGRRRT